MTRPPMTEWPTPMLRADDSVPDEGEGHAWIQWKGTSACMDVRCRCGTNGHVDADFAYFYRCPGCNVTFAVGQTVRLYEIAADCADDIAPDPVKPGNVWRDPGDEDDGGRE